jgi:hypothetical protein
MAAPLIPPSLSPLEAALVQTLTNMHQDTIKELRAFRIQFLVALCGMVAFLVSIMALLKGVDPRIAAEAVQAVAPMPAATAPVDGPGSP